MIVLYVLRGMLRGPTDSAARPAVEEVRPVDAVEEGSVEKILITGAAGRMGRMLRDRLPREDRELRFLDVVPVDEPGALVGSVADPEVVAQACKDVDAVVHLGGTAADADWDELRETNVHGAYVVFEEARRAGAQRVVYASSNHAVGFHENAPGLVEDLAPRPDGLYGLTKVLGESLGRLYHDRYGLDVVCLRIGTCYETPPTDLRTLATWLSPGDCARLVDAALSCPAPGFVAVWGISANTRRVWSLERGAAIGYHPQDDAEVFAAHAVRGDPERDEAGRRYVGGPFAMVLPEPSEGLTPEHDRRL